MEKHSEITFKCKVATKPANAPDSAFHPLIEAFADDMIVLSDTAFHAKEGDPPNLKLCARGTWNTRMLVETVLWLLGVSVFFLKNHTLRRAVL